jgi:hypothetical protein
MRITRTATVTVLSQACGASGKNMRYKPSNVENYPVMVINTGHLSVQIL